MEGKGRGEQPARKGGAPMRRMTKNLCVLLLMAIFIWGGVTVAPARVFAAKKVVRVAQQYGLWCAISTIVVQKKLIEKYAPGWEVQESRFASGADIRTALATGRLDVGISGFAPFIKGWAKGLPVKTADVMTAYKHELVTYHTEVKDIHDFVKLARSKSGFKIGAPAPGSSNHIALQWYLKNHGYDPKILDKYIVKMKHPISYQSLLSKQIDAHITSPPYAILEKKKGMKSIAALWPHPGGWMPNSQVVVNTKWAEENPEAYQAVVKAFNEAAAWAVSHPREAAEILAPTLKMSVEETLEQLKTEVQYDVSSYDIEKDLLEYANFMYEIGLIKRKPTRLSDFAFPELVQEAQKR
ncbi:MAG: ABC transporter substrate-binding protein [Nitrospinota bacterium]|nr:MAG: ABC transporter substrate-binding protein [Nitrospinota bacterium]